jgi:uncharacterized membrane protein YphA (DoxX/SURF4 family)
LHVGCLLAFLVVTILFGSLWLYSGLEKREGEPLLEKEVSREVNLEELALMGG